MPPSIHRRLAVLVILLIASALTGPLVGQIADPPPAGAAARADELQSIIARLEEREKANDLADEDKTRLDIYRQARAVLLEASKHEARLQQFVAAAARAPADAKTLKDELEKPPAELELTTTPDAKLADQEQALAQAVADRTAAQELLTTLDAEPARRKARREEIRPRLAADGEALVTLEQQLAALPLPDESPALTDARRANRTAQRDAKRALIAMLTAERESYDAEATVLSLRREQQARRVAQLDKLVARLTELVDAARTKEILRQKEEAAARARQSHPLVKEIADENKAVVERRNKLRPDSEAAKTAIEANKGDPEALRARLKSLGSKVEAVGLTSTVGLLLRKTRGTLEDTSAFEKSIRGRQERMAGIEFDRLEAKDELRLLLTTMEPRTEAIVAQLGPEASPDDREALRAEAWKQLQLQKEYLNGLIKDYDDYFGRLKALNDTQRETIDATHALADYIDERILWIRSAEPVAVGDIGRAGHALAWLFSLREWSSITGTLWTESRTRWKVIVATLAGIAVLIGLRAHLRRRMTRIAKDVTRLSTDTFARTLEALACTVGRALVWPVLMWAVGTWLLFADTHAGTELPQALGQALRYMSYLLAVLLLTRETCRPYGLGKVHFGWRDEGLKAVRRNVNWLTLVLVPMGVLVAVMHLQPNADHVSSLGRIAFFVCMATLSAFAARVLAPNRGLLSSYLARRRGGWLDRLKYVWYPLAVLLPVVLAIAAAIGYDYTAAVLMRQVGQSITMLLAFGLVNGLLLRWLFITERGLAVDEARRARAEYEQRKAKGEEGLGDVPAAPSEETHVDVSTVSEQARRLVRGLMVFFLLVGFWTIWDDALPALKGFEQIELWPGQESVVTTAATTDPTGLTGVLTGKIGDSGGAAGEPGATVAGPTEITVTRMVTLEDLLLAIIIVPVTIIVGKNIPGLLDMLILQRLPMDAGSRYAISTLMRYAITIVGVVIGCSLIGLTWSKLQWIAAAITVGLGFGLQEIFGNFVSGIMILFERPVRVGDTVTVGDMTGTVTKIRMRATTITDWDRKEIVIPNKDFVTGRIVNWTLSDPVLRLVVPVGIAYGSDTTLAEKLLLKTACEHPIVMKEPAPSVLFNGFGESSLDFKLRLFIPNIDQIVKVKHELHNAIDRAFREAGIAIAFPQRDIHVRHVGDDTGLHLGGAGDFAQKV